MRIITFSAVTANYNILCSHCTCLTIEIYGGSSLSPETEEAETFQCAHHKFSSLCNYGNIPCGLWHVIHPIGGYTPTKFSSQLILIL